MKVTITIEDGQVQIDQDKPKLGGIKKKTTDTGKVQKLTPAQKKAKKEMQEGEAEEMTKTLTKLGVEPKK